MNQKEEREGQGEVNGEREEDRERCQGGKVGGKESKYTRVELH